MTPASSCRASAHRVVALWWSRYHLHAVTCLACMLCTGRVGSTWRRGLSSSTLTPPSHPLSVSPSKDPRSRCACQVSHITSALDMTHMTDCHRGLMVRRTAYNLQPSLQDQDSSGSQDLLCMQAV
jgi:hypothetical protein